MHEWSLLNSKRRGLLEEVAREWEASLEDRKTKELGYHTFLEEHAGLFFSRPVGSYIVISNLEMGADFKPDLVVASDNESYGFRYELIELESPHDQIFTSKGRQSKKLTHALQQVEDWQRWLEKHPDSAKELFPSKAHSLWGDPQISYTVVIGRRNEMLRNNEVRTQKSKKYVCSIRSFDYITDLLRKNLFMDTGLFEDNQHLTPDEKNRISSPFFRAMSSAAWKSYRTSSTFSPAHSLGFTGPGLLEFRPENAALLDRFQKF
jgi:antiviral defense system Shedu protein SduA